MLYIQIQKQVICIIYNIIFYVKENGEYVHITQTRRITYLDLTNAIPD